MKYYVYILFSENHNRHYIGQTENIGDRIARHNKGLEKSTSPYVPWKMVFSIPKETRSAAMILERKLKKS